MQIKKIKKFIRQFNKEYEKMYDSKDKVRDYKEAVQYFDTHLEEKWFKNLLSPFVLERGDAVTSDRECAAFVFTLKYFGLTR